MIILTEFGVADKILSPDNYRDGDSDVIYQLSVCSAQLAGSSLHTEGENRAVGVDSQSFQNFVSLK